MAKAKDVVGTININLVETDYLEQEYNLSTEPTTSTITFTTTETNQLTNDYTEYAFFVCGYELYDTQAQLELVFGEETIPASGSVVFDNVKIEKYSYKDYDQQSESDAKYKKVKLSTITGTPTFANGAFNNAHSDGLFTDYPLTPDDWTLTSSTNDASCVFGVVNTSKWDLIDSTKRPSASSPLNPTFETVEGVKIPQNPQASNNILMIYNKNAATQIVTSPTFTADKNTFYALTFNYYTYGNALSIQIKDADQNIVFNDDIASSTAWNTYTILFKTEYYSVETLSLVLELNSENTNKSAYAYFDNFQFYTPSTLNNNSFQIAVDNAEKTVDLSNLGIHQTGEFNSLTSTYQPTMFTGNLESGTQIEGSAPIAFGGIITENNDYGIEFPDTHTNNINNMLMLKTLATAEYSLTSKNKISLTSGEYYKFSVYVKTSFASQIQDGQNFGAYFKLVGIDDAKIINIANHNSFNLYSIYVTVDQDTDINVQFGIVSETNDNQMALFDTFTFETISQTAFNKLTPSENLAIINHETQTTSDEEDTESTGLGGNIWIEISTILMIMAIIVAIVGALLRKTKFKKFKVKKEAEYANRAALVRDAAVVEAEKRRNTEIQSLMKEKEQLAVELKKLEEQNKERISQQRKLTGKTITRKAEKEFRAYAATRQKIVKDMGRIDDRIQEAKTPEYLGRIVKIVQMQKVKAMDETPANNQNPENA